MNLSPRQREALQFIAAGNAPKNAADLGIAYGSLKVHLALAYAKLGARNSAHAVAIALRRGLIE